MSYSIRPESKELEQARQVVETQIKTLEAVHPIDTDFKISLGWATDPLVVEDFGGAESRLLNPKELEIKFNTDPNGWKDRLRFSTVSGFAQIAAIEAMEADDVEFEWQFVLLEASSYCFLNDLMPEYKPEEFFSRGSLSPSEWKNLKEILGSSIEEGVTSLYGSEEITEFAGFRFARDLVDKFGLDFPDIVEMDLQDLKKKGDEIYG